MLVVPGHRQTTTRAGHWEYEVNLHGQRTVMPSPGMAVDLALTSPTGPPAWALTWVAQKIAERRAVAQEEVFIFFWLLFSYLSLLDGEQNLFLNVGIRRPW